MHQLVAWWYFKIRGWKIEGAFPYHLKKSVIIVAPHTHYIDFFLGMAFRKKLHLEFVHFLGKKELFIPPFGWILRSLGGRPVDRSKTNHLVEEVASMFKEKETFHIALSPEGTRTKVTRLRTGFYHIAKNAQAPIVMIGLDFANRKVVFAAPIETSVNQKADMLKIIEFFSAFKGRIPAYGITKNTEC